MNRVHPGTGDEDNGSNGKDNTTFNDSDGNETVEMSGVGKDSVTGDSKKPPSKSDDSAVVNMDSDASNEKSKEAGVDGVPAVAVFGAGSDDQPSAPADKPYAGMGKEDLLRFSETDFWKRARLITILLFWAAWLALLGAVIGLTIVAPRCDSQPSPAWWQQSVVYQIYVRSFYDNSTDGIGDLHGIANKLPYLKDLGVDAILLSSVFDSNAAAGADYGYEITNHTNIASDYGTLADFQALLNASHSAGIKVLVDFVPNHSGVNHPWFIGSQAATGPADPYWNYYVWAECSNYLPNNWLSVYNQAAWSQANPPSARGCYLHQFLGSQPELNLRSSAVQHELEEILHYWLKLGVDGFRVVNTAYLFESPDLQNETINGTCSSWNQYDCLTHTYTRSLPESYDIVRRWRQIVDSYAESTGTTRVLLTDADVEIHKATQYYGDKYGLSGSHLAINYGLATLLNTTSAAAMTGSHLESIVRSWIDSMPSGATANWLTGDQDRSRLQWNVEVFNLLKLTLPGTSFIYYGEEIGMANGVLGATDPTDPAGQPFSRYEYRTPMQWNNTVGGGFTESTTGPWLSLGNLSINAVDQSRSDSSSWALVKQLIKLRHDEGSLQYGATHIVKADDKLFSFVREHEGNSRILVAVNVGTSETGEVDLTKQKVFKVPGKGEVAFVTHPSDMPEKEKDTDLRKLKLKPGQGIVVTWDYSRPFP